MAQFQVPQFIETEAKIVGPLTLKQFLYIAAAGLLSFFLFFILKTVVWFIVVALIATVAVSLAFVKYNGRPLTVILKSALGYAWKPKLYLWKSEPTPEQPQIQIPVAKKTPVSRLKDMWLKVQTSISQKPVSPPKAPILHGFPGEKAHASGAFEILKKIGEKKPPTIPRS